MKFIPLNKPSISFNAKRYMNQCFENSSFENGYFTKAATQQLQDMTQAKTVLLTTSCTAALEIAALSIDIKPGDEIIMPSYTFVSTANAFVLRGGIPVFVDIRPDTLVLNEKLIEAAITEKTKAIVPVHYAGISCEMDAIQKISEKYKLFIIEDAAQGILSTYKNQPLGSLGHMAALSFHHTKNIIAGFGGALLINDDRFIHSAKIFWQKGTNREAFVAGFVDKYTWVDKGSAFLLNEINAALLCSQLEEALDLTQRRLSIWNRYHAHFSPLVQQKKITAVPTIPEHCKHNAHIYYLILNSAEQRTQFIENMKKNQIETSFHYIPLHTSPGGKKYGRFNDILKYTDDYAQRIVRLPLYPDLLDNEINYIIDSSTQCLEREVVNGIL